MIYEYNFIILRENYLSKLQGLMSTKQNNDVKYRL